MREDDEAEVRYVPDLTWAWLWPWFVAVAGLVLFASGAWILLESPEARKLGFGLLAAGGLACCAGIGFGVSNPLKYRVVEIEEEEDEEDEEDEEVFHVTRQSAKRRDYDPTSVENRMWCPECKSWKLARRRKQHREGSIAIQICVGLLMFVMGFYLLGPASFIIVMLGVGFFAVVGNILNQFRITQPDYLCTQCGSLTELNKP